ncbi:hypothetical protein [Rubinisphaera margarita]|uniref:hypothetical protein n=1 Tax=Rubinisphaera margarita TaxID=2909586 RepID=UPI001EE7C9B6|nr:hypothetical protein [Rubinisphaera margarita]MCG6156297.1 hypothetical protein [Rubinisphaera margarita]
MDPLLPIQIDQILSRLRSSIRRYVFIRGLALVLATLAVLFWLTLSFDTLWFSATRLEIPRPVRLLIVIASLALVIGIAYQALIWQMLIKLKRRALAMLLERRFPELRDRLITVVEMSESNDARKPSALTQSMMQRTVADASRLVNSLEIDSVFNFRPLRIAVVAATIGLVSLITVSVASPSTVSRWSDAYLGLEDEYWVRRNGLELFVVAQPGDRIRNFEDHTLRHATGADLTIMARVLPDKLPPEQVVVSYRTSTGARGRALMAPAGKGEFRHTIGDLVDDLEFTVTGGDFTTPQPYKVIAVPEPAISSMKTVCTYPEYTGWNQSGVGDERERQIDATEITVPMETELELKATSTKPLKMVRITGRGFEVKLDRSVEGRSTAVCSYLDDRGIPFLTRPIAETSAPFISQDGLNVSVGMLVTQRETLAPTPENVEQASGGPVQGAVILREETLRILLQDESDIVNLEPIRLVIRGRRDESPQVTTRLVGIGKAITRKALIPFQGELSDDYGLASTQFEYRIDQAEETETRPTVRQPANALEFAMRGTAEQPAEKFDVLPLELNVGQVLFLNLLAADVDTINGPHLSRSETYRLKIVSDEELLSLLHQDELNLRRRFEQLIDELTRSRDDFAGAAIPPSDAEGSSEPLPLPDAVQRTLNTLRKDSIEADAIRLAFDNILRELINNRVETPQMRSRLQEKIIAPLSGLLEQEFAQAENNFRLLDFSLQQNTSTDVTPAVCLADMDRLLTGLRQILVEMRKLESFQEVIELLKGIIDDQKALREKTEEERKKKLIDLLN